MRLANVDYTFGSEGEANRTGGLPLDVSKVRRIWPCQGGEGHFMARLVKAGTPRVLPAEGEYTAEEQLWLAAAEAAGKKAKGKGGKPAKTLDARSARRENARACREAVQGDKRSREAQAGETSPAQSLAAWHAFARQYFPALVDRPALAGNGQYCHIKLAYTFDFGYKTKKVRREVDRSVNSSLLKSF